MAHLRGDEFQAIPLPLALLVAVIPNLETFGRIGKACLVDKVSNVGVNFSERAVLRTNGRLVG